MGRADLMPGKRGTRSSSSLVEIPSKRMKYEIEESTYDNFERLFVESATEFLEPNADLHQRCLELVTALYNQAKSDEIIQFPGLEELITENMDSDQIWAQLHMFSKPLFKYSERILNRTPTEESEESDSDSDSSDVAMSDQEPDESSSLSDEELNQNQQHLSSDEQDSDQAEMEEEISPDEQEPSDQEPEDENLEDDPFFDYDEMERFIEEDERRLNNPDEEDDEDDEDDDDEVLEYLNRGSDGELEIDWEKMKNKEAGDSDDDLPADQIRFDDFYETPKSLSRHQKGQESMKSTIQMLEEQNIQEKSWQLKGEVSSRERPQDSLLEEFVIFDHATKTAPVITEEKTYELEDIIRRRIKEESWDDVVRRKLIVDQVTKEKSSLDHEKSKVGLAEVYEREYLGSNQIEDEEALREKHREVLENFRVLCHKLDALSNFHFTPGPITMRERETNDVAAINLEEVLPTAASEGSQLAPEEIYKATRAPKGQSELTSEEKTQLRKRAKNVKKKQKQAAENERKLDERINPELANTKYKKVHDQKNLRQLQKAKNVEFASKGKETFSYTKSTAFFNKLQQDAQQEIAKQKPSKKTQKKSVQSRSLKL